MVAGFAQIARVVLAALALSLLAAPTAQAARSEFFGVNQGPPLDDADFPGIAATGVKTTRFLLAWMSIEKSRGQRDWSKTDELVGGLASHGIRPVPFAWGSPSWAQPGGFKRAPLSNRRARRAWQSFLKAAVSRYGRGGSYWGNGYRQQFGQAAVPLPITSWQIWNEPNGRAQFDHPGATVEQAAQLYARLLRISHDAIRSKDRKAEVVAAGVITQGDPHVSDFLGDVYSVPGIKGDFDAVAVHPYAPSVKYVRAGIKGIRKVMAKNGDRATPLWITELGWGSAPADGAGINLGLAGQARMLTRSFKPILAHRSAWNLQRLYWFDWRDPPPGSHYNEICGRCGSAGLLTYDRIPKPAFDAFLALTAETTPPQGRITSGPGQGSFAKDPTPSFSFTSNEAGSTFACRIGAGPLRPCASPYTAPRLSQGPHAFRVKAIDAAGNESPVVSRSFTVDSRPPPMPQIAGIAPKSPANNNAPRIRGSAEPASTVKLYRTAGCKGSPIRGGPAAKFASPGITIYVGNNTATRVRATATDAAGNRSPCSAARTYVEDSIAPQTTITGGPSGPTMDSTPTFTFTSDEARSTFRCRFDQRLFAPCSGPRQSDTPSTPLTSGPHTFSVRATDRAQNTDWSAAKFTFRVVP
jgi:Glycosyl hydrolase catalytic core